MVLHNNATPTEKPTATAPGPAPKQTAALAHNATAPTPAAAVLASVAAMPAAAAAANTQQSPANAAKQSVPPATHRQLDYAAKKKSEQVERRRRDAGEAELEQLQNKRKKRITRKLSPPTGSGGEGDPVANKHDSYLTIPPLLEGVGLDCF